MSIPPTVSTDYTNQLAPLRLPLSQIKHLALRHGQQIELTIIKQLVGQKWLIALQGRVLRAIANIPLQRGQQFVATVSLENGQVLLRQQTATTATLLEQLYSSGTAVSGRLIEAMLRSGLPLTPTLYRELSRRLKDKKQGDSQPPSYSRSAATPSSSKIASETAHAETIRLLTIAYKKRLPLNQKELIELNQPATPGATPHSSPPRYTTPLEIREMSTQLAAMLRQRLQHSSTTTQSPLALFNHMADGTHHWVIVPLFLSLLAIKGQLRLHLAGKPLRSVDLVVAIQEERYRWYIHVQLFDSRRGAITLYIPDLSRCRPLTARLADLQNTLQSYGEYQLRILQEWPDFDGFDSRASHRQVVDINA